MAKRMRPATPSANMSARSHAHVIFLRLWSARLINNVMAHNRKAQLVGENGNSSFTVCVPGSLAHEVADTRGRCAVCVLYSCLRKIVAQALWQKLLFFKARVAVGLHAKQKVVAEAGPRVLGGVTVYHLAERYVGSVCRACGVAGGLVVDNRTFNTPYYNIACACCAVVIEIIVPVDTVLGTVVLVDGLQQGELLFSVQVELLLQNAAAHTLISGTELLEGLYAYLIVGQSEHEPKHEVWLAKGEHAVVDGEVCTHSSIGAMVLYAYGGVAIETVHALPWLAGEQTYLYRIHFLK